MISVQELFNAWNSFFFTLQPASTIGLIRIFFGLLVFIDSIILFRYKDYCFSIEGTYPWTYWKKSNYSIKRLSLFNWLAANNTSVDIVLVGLIIGSFCLTIGYLTDLAALVVFLCWVSLSHRNLYILNAGDSLMRLFSFLFIFASSGYGLSVDNYLHNRDQFYTLVCPWAHRLMMIQICIVYLWSLKPKLSTSIDWINGSAVYYALLNKSISRNFFTDKYLRSMCLGIKLATWATLCIELLIAVGLWTKELNVLCIIIGISFHIWLEVNLRLGVFSWIMIVGILSFINPTSLSKCLESAMMGIFN